MEPLKLAIQWADEVPDATDSSLFDLIFPFTNWR